MGEASNINDGPLVSAVMITYNHRGFIVQAIESILAQKTNFQFELIIGDDCSTDGTREIVAEYVKKHPERIVAVTSEKNVGMHQNMLRVERAARGKYIAYCEGDDVWHDPLKLAKQAAFLEGHPDYSMAHSHCHRFLVGQNRLVPNSLSVPTQLDDARAFEDILLGIRSPLTVTVMARKEKLFWALDHCPECTDSYWPMGDTQRWLELSRLGKIGCLHEPLATTNVMLESAGQSQNPKKRLKFYLKAREIKLVYMKKYPVAPEIERAVREKLDLILLRHAFNAEDESVAKDMLEDYQACGGQQTARAGLLMWGSRSSLRRRLIEPLLNVERKWGRLRTRLNLGVSGLAFLAGLSAVQAQTPMINSLLPGTELSWSGGQGNRAAAIQIATNLFSPDWSTVKYDLATNGTRRVILPATDSPASFYRVAVLNTPPDSNLVLHLTFENDFSPLSGVTNGVLVDNSGYDNHGWSYPLAGTNVYRFPTLTEGPDGGPAGDFRMYYDGYGKYGRSGDHVVIPMSPSFSALTNATIMAWARYYREDYFPDSPRFELVQNCTILNAYYQGAPWSWTLGRNYSPSTVFTVLDPLVGDLSVVTFPDLASSRDKGGDTGGWNHYAVTFNNGVFRGYYNGQDLGQTAIIRTNVLLASRYYIALGCWNFGRAPSSGTYTAGYPNAGWMYGAIDDVRIYKSVLSTQEIYGIYLGFDKKAPTMPTNFRLLSATSTQATLAWNPAIDNFNVVNYRLWRDGVLLAELAGTNYVDTNITTGHAYSFSIQAFDPAGNVSAASGPISLLAP